MWNLFTHFFKCRHLIWLPVLCVTLAGCKDDFDDSELRKQIADLDGRLTSLEKLCAQMNTNISSMQTIVNALQQNDYITGVTPITEGGNTTGYSITFAKNKPITIYHGKNGSSLSAKKDADGIYYWELNGSWLLDDENNRMKVSGVTPQLKIENEHWLVSVDGGKTWDDAGTATRDPLFKEVDNSAEDFVKFVFADGTEVQVPKKDTFAISFSEPLPLKISAGETVVITYTLSQGGEKTLVKTVCSNGWQAVVNKKDNLSGTITITAPDPITDDEVLVFVSDGKEKTVMSAISFCIVILDNIQDNTVKVGGGDGNLNLEITSNMEIKAVPKNEWIITDEQPQSKALATNHFHFKILANGDKQNRTGHIEVQDMGGKVLKTITVVQGNALEEEIAPVGEMTVVGHRLCDGRVGIGAHAEAGEAEHPADLPGFARIHERKAHDRVGDETDRRNQRVLEEDVRAVLRPAEAGFDRRETEGHQKDQHAADQHPEGVDVEQSLRGGCGCGRGSLLRRKRRRRSEEGEDGNCFQFVHHDVISESNGIVSGWHTGHPMASGPCSPVRMRMQSSIGRTKIFPSPIRPVRAPAMMPSSVVSTKSSLTPMASRTFLSRLTSAIAPRYASTYPFCCPQPSALLTDILKTLRL